jgi:hypothetical protein
MKRSHSTFSYLWRSRESSWVQLSWMHPRFRRGFEKIVEAAGVGGSKEGDTIPHVPGGWTGSTVLAANHGDRPGHDWSHERVTTLAQTLADAIRAGDQRGALDALEELCRELGANLDVPALRVV